MLVAVPIFGLLAAILLDENRAALSADFQGAPLDSSFGAAPASPLAPSSWYGNYDARVVYGATRLAEIEKEITEIARRNAGFDQVEIFALIKERDGVILAGKSPMDLEARQPLERVRSLMPNIGAPDSAELTALIAERDNLLRRQRTMVEDSE